MFRISLFIIGFVVAFSEPLGSSIITGLQYMVVIQWIIFIASILLAILLIWLFIEGGREIINKTQLTKYINVSIGAFSGGVLGMLMGAIIISMSAFSLWLNYFLQNSINPNTHTFTDLGIKNLVVLIVLFGLIIFSKVTTKNVKTS
jgi:hypothetical protein